MTLFTPIDSLIALSDVSVKSNEGLHFDSSSK